MRGALLALLGALGAVLLAAGCGSIAAGEEAGGAFDGKQLFSERCGSCHTLADAGTKGAVGPDLDQAFDDIRTQGFEESTIREVVRGQIEYPVSNPGTEGPGMPGPEETLKGLGDRDGAADAIAAYVASVAGKPAAPGQAEAPPSDPKQLFIGSCGACHVLADAGTSGTIGPNLDQTKPSLERAIEQITNGGGGMPAFGDQLSEEQIRALAEYVVRAAGG